MKTSSEDGLQDHRWWLSIQGAPTGPHSEAYVLAGLKTGAIAPGTYACPVEGQEWKRLSEWVMFATVCPAAAPAPPPPPPAPASAENPGQPLDSPFSNPALPRMGNWICIYAILVLPVYWFVDNLSCLTTGPTFKEASRCAGAEVLAWLFGFLFSLATVIVLLLGGLRLRALRRSGATLLTVGFWCDLLCAPVALVVGLALIMTADQGDIVESTPLQNAIFVFVQVPIGVLAYSFEIFALVWLYRNARLLRLSST